MRVQSLLLPGLLLVLLACAKPAHAAESYDNCTGFITTLPAVISTSGTWCLKQDLATAISSGNAILINSNNVTVDCNNFKLGGLAAGVATQTNGIYAYGRVNATIRHCNIRGFYFGVVLVGTASTGHTIEDNRFDGNTYTAIALLADASIIRRNRIIDTGGSTVTPSESLGIDASGEIDIQQNIIAGVVATVGGNGNTYGIRTDLDERGTIEGNSVRGLLVSGVGAAYGIYNTNADNLIIRDNVVFGDGGFNSIGLRCDSPLGRARDNVIANFPTAKVFCTMVSGNDVY